MTEWDAAVAAMTDVVVADLQAALAEAEAARERVYYDTDADTTARQAYYAGLDPETPDPAGVRQLLTATHTTQPRYKPAVEVYPWVDLHPDGLLRSLYTGESYTPADLIQADVSVVQARVEAMIQTTLADPAAADLTEMDLEAVLPFNCEHVVPQSWFGKDEPMRGDLHHLFSCESRCNSFRGNTPYREFPAFPSPDDDGTGVMTECGKSQDRGFEPMHGKGPSARAVMYFALRYPDLIDPTEMAPEVWRVVLDWHHAEPVTAWEQHRNAAIAERQGNRNPFIDHPAWAGHLTGAPGR